MQGIQTPPKVQTHYFFKTTTMEKDYTESRVMNDHVFDDDEIMFAEFFFRDRVNCVVEICDFAMHKGEKIYL